ncbi:hypothetical protein F4805DRAFT_425671 [Annulohypoxylon moriforme]|nr:hypothetical protein F4805DRAFT_425671 [Annulohypoxylon moriforme]
MVPDKEYNVVVTACAPFKENERNPTQDVKLRLPECIERKGRIPIKIIKYPTDFRNVITDMDIIPTLWNGKRSVYEPSHKRDQEIYIDAMLHLGMNFSDVWQVETRARRDGYEWVGDDGVPLPKYNGGKGGRWKGLPKVLKPFFKVERIVKRLHEELPNTPTMISKDAGLLYCEFIFYTSLSTLFKKGETQRVVFLHHAGNKTESRDIEEGANVGVSVICSMIDQLEESKKKCSPLGHPLWRQLLCL